MAKLKVFVKLYELLLTAQKDDRSGHVVSTGSLKIDDLIQIAVSRRSDIHAITMKVPYETNSIDIRPHLVHRAWIGIDRASYAVHSKRQAVYREHQAVYREHQTVHRECQAVYSEHQAVHSERNTGYESL